MPQSSALSSITFKQLPSGSVTNINAVGSVTWSLNRAPFEVSEIGNADAQFIAGYQNSTAQLDVFYLEADHAIFEANITSALAAGELELTLTSGDTLNGTGFVTSYSVTAAANDVVRASIGIQFTGALTIT
jgi:hypothetical protein